MIYGALTHTPKVFTITLNLPNLRIRVFIGDQLWAQSDASIYEQHRLMYSLFSWLVVTIYNWITYKPRLPWVCKAESITGPVVVSRFIQN